MNSEFEADYPILKAVHSPEAVRSLRHAELLVLCDELRHYLIETISRTGGHLASGLGVIELTVALHHVYQTPFDQLIWDVGHQAYPHKILTGRCKAIHSIRQFGGLAPFPHRLESEYDAFSTGHSSTSISAGLGMCIAAQLQKQAERKVVCIVGDAAMTAGMSFEALNHAGSLAPNLLVILNDNRMSISKNIGALHNYFAELLSGGPCKVFRPARTTKGIAVPGALFEELGFNYVGPIDGHDLEAVIQHLGQLSAFRGPQFLHVVTQKGKGYAPAETDPIHYHSVPSCVAVDPKVSPQPHLEPESYSELFGSWLCERAEKDQQVIAITPAMAIRSGMLQFQERFPERFFDVAIAEQHAVTFAAGAACLGMKPVVALYSTFLQRAYDQVIHDVALQNLPILFAIDRAGLVGHDGSTHQGAFDIACLRTIPNLVIMVPGDQKAHLEMLELGYSLQGPSVVRYPKGSPITLSEAVASVDLGKAVILKTGNQWALLNFGSLLAEAFLVAEALDLTLVDMRFVKPLDGDLLETLALSKRGFITLEEHAIMGGAGSAVNEYLMAQRIVKPVLNIGFPDAFIPHGSVPELKEALGLDVPGLIKTIKGWVEHEVISSL